MARAWNTINRRRWARVRRRVLDRDAWRCVKCGRAGRLEVDHVRPLGHSKIDPYDDSNLQTLCRGCHIEKTRLERTGPESPDVAEWEKLLESLP
ncbi:MAG: HNH endonuclease signature motif containing protein [Gammaproteobacteria bacterium]|nr:HNH endonuclease signature motif containing protein [Gammaproteobacteria bacterium]MDE0273543.1 HNH endonuclease signature motif containing protein [Gammaproteobacteria bacterium]